MSKNREKKHAEHLAKRKAHAHEVVESTAEHHEQHLVEAPKGTSRARFLFNFLLVVFLLLIFSITGPMMQSLSGGGGPSGETAMSWTTPDGERRSIEISDWYTEKQRLASLEDFGNFLLLGPLERGDEIQLARFLILEGLAQRAGIHVADQEVADTILEFFQTKENYDNYLLRSRGRKAKPFEQMLRRGLVVRRYIQMAAVPAGEVLTEDVLERWKQGAKEHDFEYVEVLAEEFEEAARAALPADAELEDWFNGLSEFQKREFNTERSFALDVAWLDPSLPSQRTALFERFPRPEEEDAEQLATVYFNSNSFTRFVRPEPAPPEDDEGAEDGAQDDEPEPQDKYYSYEEVADQARREAPIYRSMMDWLSDLRKRQAEGEALDLETEAIALGLEFQRVEPRSMTVLRESEEPWGGPFFAGSVNGVPEGEMTRRVGVTEGAFAVARVVEILPPALPPFAEIRDGVADKWVRENRPRLAAEALEAIRDAFGERPEDGEFETAATSEEFRAAVEAAGFEVQQRGWASQFPRAGDPEQRTTQIENYLRSRMTLFSMEPGAVAEAEATRDGNVAYLVRYVGEREADQTTMRPIEAAQALSQAKQTSQMDYFSETLGSEDWLRSEFNLYLRSEELEAAEGDA